MQIDQVGRRESPGVEILSRNHSSRKMIHQSNSISVKLKLSHSEFNPGRTKSTFTRANSTTLKHQKQWIRKFPIKNVQTKCVQRRGKEHIRALKRIHFFIKREGETTLIQNATSAPVHSSGEQLGWRGGDSRVGNSFKTESFRTESDQESSMCQIGLCHSRKSWEYEL